MERNDRSASYDVACMGQTLVTIVGTILSLIGTACAAVAFRGTWRQHGDGPMYPQLATWIGRARLGIRKLLGTQADTVVGMGAAVTATASISARATVTGPAIPPDADTDHKVELLIRRVENLERAAAEDRGYQALEVAAVRQRINSVSSDAVQLAAAIEAKAKSMVLDSVRLQLVGLASVGIGTVLLAASGFMG